jgi:hypothetical protein
LNFIEENDEVRYYFFPSFILSLKCWELFALKICL